MKLIAQSTAINSPDALLQQSTSGNYWVNFGDLGFLITDSYDEASEYYKACVLKQLETL